MKLPPKIRKILTVVTYVIVALMILFVSIILYFKISGKPFWVFDRTLMWVKTGSMEPTIPAKSYILVKKVDGNDVEEGDIITFESPTLGGQLNTHRVNRVLDDGRLETLGDNNNGAVDKPITRNLVIAKYCRNLPVLSFFGRIFTTPIGITVTILVVVVIMVLLYFEDISALFNASSKKKAEAEKQQKIDELIKAEIDKLKAEDSKNDNDTDQGTGVENV
ncbi:MAG: signal peptidase I [Clostridia bacterium]|nr:signal peptidase I [Clostridia bacterium]